MQQKTMSLHYLTIGISLFISLLFFSCGDKSDDNNGSSATTYVYKNQSDYAIQLQVYNFENEIFEEYTIPINESVSIPFFSIGTGKGIISPFQSGSNALNVADKLVVRFNNVKCLTYSENEGLLFPKNYDNYSDSMLYSNVNTLEKTFDNSDFASAVDCP